MSSLYIIGLGGHAKVVAAIALAVGLPVTGFLDGVGSPTSGQSLLGLPILGDLSLLNDSPSTSVLLGVGNNQRRADLADRIKRFCPNALFPCLIHPTSICEFASTLHSHVVLCAASFIGAEATIGEGALVNSNASVDHECTLGRYVHVSPGAQLAGKVTVGDYTHIGIGATVIEGKRIGHHAIVGAGAVVIHDVPDYATVVGVPARIIKTLNPPRSSA